MKVEAGLLDAGMAASNSEIAAACALGGFGLIFFSQYRAHRAATTLTDGSYEVKDDADFTAPSPLCLLRLPGGESVWLGTSDLLLHDASP